jgi:hypothetical protein
VIDLLIDLLGGALDAVIDWRVEHKQRHNRLPVRLASELTERCLERFGDTVDAPECQQPRGHVGEHYDPRPHGVIHDFRWTLSAGPDGTLYVEGKWLQ